MKNMDMSCGDALTRLITAKKMLLLLGIQVKAGHAKPFPHYISMTICPIPNLIFLDGYYMYSV